jgi:hypothetical protein
MSERLRDIYQQLEDHVRTYEGRGEARLADATRDLQDVLWYRLSDEARRWLNGREPKDGRTM